MRSIKNRLLLKGRKNKKTIITILFAIVAMAGQAQTANDYWIAADKALAAGNTDSTFYYLNLFREHLDNTLLLIQRS